MIILLLQIDSMACQSGRRTDQYRDTINETQHKRHTIKNKGVVDKWKSKDQGIKTLDKLESNHSSPSGIQRQKQRPSSIDITKIKTLLPYVILKRAYSKLKDTNTSTAINKLVFNRSRQNMTLSEKLFSALCKNYSTSSICKLVSVENCFKINCRKSSKTLNRRTL